ncbi:MAG: hypothetical protein WA947_19995 [Phormidesmis sp.]
MINLIDKWKNEKGQTVPIARVVQTLSPEPDETVLQLEKLLDNKLFDLHQAGEIQPVCGNKHASKGAKRVLSGGVEHLYTEANELNEILESLIPSLGNRVLISAGHFMPLKENFCQVNHNSFQSLQDGLSMLKRLHGKGVDADLLITINDVTVSKSAEQQDDLPTLSQGQRQSYYEDFRLPEIYTAEIEKVMAELETDFKVIVIGENKLSEKLSKDVKKLRKQGLLTKSPDQNAYLLPFDVSPIVKLAHGDAEVAEFYDVDSPVFISNQKGLTGRPKCVRACARLAEIPYELNYTGYFQFLPVCSRNAIEGFLVGGEIYRRKYEQDMPYISVHNVRSCF